MITVNAYAKINMYLHVVSPPRADGFHDLNTVFQEISLHDTLHFTTATDVFAIDGMDSVPMQSNLIWKAWNLLRRDFGASRVAPVRVLVDKRIPAGGGLGGGSSDAAATLRVLNDLFGLDLDTARLIRYAADLGSDCAFFILGGTAVAMGRGEVLIPVADVPSRPLLLAFPNKSVPTGPAFRLLDSLVPRAQPRADATRMAELLRGGDDAQIADAMHNDFELVVRDADWYRAACADLAARGGVHPMLSGSGSTVFALAPADVPPHMQGLSHTR